MRKKLLAAIILFLFMVCLSIPAEAATNIVTGTTYNGSLTSTVRKNEYKFNISKSGQINLVVTAKISSTNYYIYDNNGAKVWSTTNRSWNSNTQQLSLNENIDLTSGSYTLQITSPYSTNTGTYSFKLNYSPYNESFKESGNGTNNSIATASQVNVNHSYMGQLAVNDTKDFYKFSLNNAGRIKFFISANIRDTNYYLYDEKGTELWSCTNNRWDNNTNRFVKEFIIDVAGGGRTYILAIRSTYSTSTGTYSFTLGYGSAGESFPEGEIVNNNTLSTARPVSLGTSYNGQLAINDEKDFYQFEVNTAGKVILAVTAKIYSSDYYIYNNIGTEIWKSTNNRWDDSSQQLNLEKSIDLSAGRYILLVQRRYSYTGNYTFSLRMQKSASAVPQAQTGTAGQSSQNNGGGQGAAANVRANGISLNTYSLAMYLGTSARRAKNAALYVGFSPANTTNKRVSWTSTNYAVASVSGSGVVSARGVWTATIICSTLDGSNKRAYCQVTVVPGRASFGKIKIKKNKATMNIKKQSQATGYQIFVSKSKYGKYKRYKTIKAKKRSITVTKKYYLRHYFKVRAYKKVGGKTYYGEFSAIK